MDLNGLEFNMFGLNIDMRFTFSQVLVRLVAADDHVYPNFSDVMQWLADSNLLEMIVDKLSPSVSEKV